jgi:hypothetical protein
MDQAEHPLTTLNLPVDTQPGEEPFLESVLVEHLGGARYLVQASPGMLAGFAKGDEIELAPDDPFGYRVVRRGGNVCIQIYWGELRQSAAALESQVRAVGGWCDGDTPGLLVFTVPVAAGFSAIEQIFEAATVRYPGSSWFYGNVYDPIDGVTPLDWWKPGEQRPRAL